MNSYQELTRKWPDKYTQRTYRMTEELVERLTATADAYQVGISDLVRFLLTRGLDQIDAGELVIPTKAAGLRVIEHD